MILCTYILRCKELLTFKHGNPLHSNIGNQYCALLVPLISVVVPPCGSEDSSVSSIYDKANLQKVTK